jgi:selenocysteine lyase/cysteine desulfurase
MQGDWDIMRPRAETAGCEQSIFFNNAGASLQPRALVARVIEYLPLEEQAGGYEAADRVQGELERSYGSVDRLLHCAPEEIALQENATPAWEMAGATPGNSSAPTRNVKASRPRSCLGMFFLNELFLQAEGPDVVP